MGGKDNERMLEGLEGPRRLSDGIRRFRMVSEELWEWRKVDWRRTMLQAPYVTSWLADRPTSPSYPTHCYYYAQHGYAYLGLLPKNAALDYYYTR